MTEIIFCSIHQFFRWINSNQGIVSLTVAGIQIWLAWWAVIMPLRQSKIDRDNSVLDLLKSEFVSNLLTINENLTNIDNEIVWIPQMKTNVRPLLELRNASLVYFFSNIPEAISSNPSVFKLVQKVIQEVEPINGLVRFHQAFKIQEGGNALALDRLKVLDEIIRDRLNLLKSSITELAEKL